jgi:NADH-quinone oxidoreductase subunit E
MLTDDERREIEEALVRYPDGQSACIDAMMSVQRRRGWVSDEAIREISDILRMTPDELDGVATFYNRIFRKPVGRHVIYVCDSVSCWIMGYESVLSHMSGRLGIGLGETTPDGRFTLLPIMCLGACDHAPALMVDDDLHADVDPRRIDEILDRYR